MICVHLGYNLATVFYGPVIYFLLMLMSTGCLAPLASPDGYSRLGQYSNFSFNIVIVVIYFRARESTNKDYCCCCFCLN